MFTRRNYALLMFKIDSDNHYQIEQASRSYYLLVLSSHWYLKRITATETNEIKDCHSATFPRSTKKLTCSARDQRGESREIEIGFWLGDLNWS